MEHETVSSLTMTERPNETARENIDYPFQPDPLLSEQFFDHRRPKMPLEPEKRLMLAVLEDAFYCFQENYAARHGKKKQLFDKVEQWFFGTSNDWVFSFENICSVVGFNPEYLRKGLVRWRENQRSKYRSAYHNRGNEPTRVSVPLYYER